MTDELTKESLDRIIDIQAKLFHNDFLKKIMHTHEGIIIQLQNVSDEYFKEVMEEMYGGETIEIEDEEGNVTTEKQEIEIFYKNEVDGKYGYFEKNNCCFINSPGGEGGLTADDIADVFYLFNAICSDLFNGTLVLFNDTVDFGAYSLLHDPEYSFKPNIFQRMKGAKTELGLLDQLKVRYKRKESNITFKYNGIQVIM